MCEALSEKYKELVKKVYLDPIRSVVVVDDDFPTLDDLLSSAVVDAPIETSKANGQTPAPTETKPIVLDNYSNAASVTMRFKGNISDVDRMKGLLRLCRERTPPWMVDVHDGRADTGLDELRLAPSLHQSDLMILDFHLNGDHGDGQRAIDILRTLASNDQFNLVIVYTKGIAGEINAVFEQIAESLMHRDWDGPCSESKLKATKELIAEWEDEDPDLNLTDQLLNSFSTLDYLRLRTEKYSFEGSGTEQLISGLLQKCPAHLKLKKIRYEDFDGNEKTTVLSTKSIFEFLIMLKHGQISGSLSKTNHGLFFFDICGEKNWIRSDRIFITVINKTNHDPRTLEDCLLDALKTWAPGPHQLLMGRMRAELGEKGVCAEGAVLANRPLQAGWLRDFLAKDADAETVMTQSINRHWEALGDRIHHDVKIYAKEMFDYFQQEDRDALMNKYMLSDVANNDRLAHLNYYYSTKPIDSLHITTGHVLQFYEDDVDEKLKFWICLSPACDLVPGQKAKGWKSRLGQAMPFIAVQLEKTKIDDAIKEVNQNRFVFLQLNNKIEAFKFTSDSHSTSLPVWEQMFASNTGRISRDNGRHELHVRRMRDEEGTLIMTPSPAIVVCQLRYEYALNFLQRLGTALSRVGLDFRSI